MHATRKRVAVVVVLLLLCNANFHVIHGVDVCSSAAHGAYAEALNTTPPQDETLDDEPVTTKAPAPEKTQSFTPTETPTPKQEKTPPSEPEKTPPLEPEETPAPKPEETPAPKPEETPTPKREETPTPEPDQTPIPDPDETPTPDPEETHFSTPEDIAPMPTEGHEGVDESGTENPEDEPLDDDEQTPGFALGSGTMSVGAYSMPSAAPDGALTLAIPLCYALDKVTYKSNAAVSGGVLPYRSEHTAQDYDQTLTGLLEGVETSIAAVQAEDFPLEQIALRQKQALLSNGENKGYAVFERLTIQEDAKPGIYPVRLLVTWRGVDTKQDYSETVLAMVEVLEPAENLMQDAPPEETDGEEPEASNLSIGAYVTPSAVQGCALTLAIPVCYTVGEQEYASNADGQGGIMPYESVLGSGEYDQSIADRLSFVHITIDDEQAADFPLDLQGFGGQQAVILQGENQGYAVFSDISISVMDGARPGEYPVHMKATYQEIGSEELHIVALTAAVQVNMTYPENCQCCEHCVQCFTQDQQPAVLSCACVDEQGMFTGCLCDCPFLNPDYMAPEEAGKGEEQDALAEGEQLGDGENDVNAQWINCGCACHAMLMAAAVMRDDGGVIVYSYAELYNVATNGTFDLIYLGYNETNKGTILMSSSGMDIANTLDSLTIDGTDPISGTVMLLESPGSTSDTNSIRTGKAGQTITIQNAKVRVGGSKGIIEGTFVNSTLRMTNVTLSGIAAMYTTTAGSKAVFTSCSGTLADMAHANGFARRLVTGSTVEFYGTNTFSRSSYTGTFEMIGLAGTCSLFIAPGAVVTLSSDDYILWATDLSGTDVTVAGTLNMTSTSSQGCVTHGANFIGEFTIARGGVVNITDNGAGAGGSLQAKTLTAQGTLNIVRTNSPVLAACIAVYYLGGSATFDLPAYVNLVNTTGGIMRAYGGTTETIPIKITTQALNYHSNANGKYVWNNKGVASFTTTINVSSYGRTGSVSTNLSPTNIGVAIAAPALTAATFDLYHSGGGAPANPSNRISFGQYTLTINNVVPGGKVVTGTVGGGTLNVDEYALNAGLLGARLQTVEAQGNYRATFPNPIGDSSRVYVRSVYSNGLEAHNYEDILPGCFFYEVPELVDFGEVAISAKERWLDPQNDWNLAIADTRPAGGWRLYANAAPFITEGGVELDGNLVFVDGGTSTSIQGQDVLIASKPTLPQGAVTSLDWPDGEGFRLRLQPLAGKPGEQYEATITWALVVGPP